MEIKRKAYDRLLKWKASRQGSKALLIKGARRVGKSFLAETFAKREYRSYIMIDFASPMSGTKRIFDTYGNRQTLGEFFNQLSVLYGTRLYPGDSCIIFDEVQKLPAARELVKYLVADGRYDYIETGSLISIKQNVKDIVIPSEEEELSLYPLDFEEFLGATGGIVTVDYLRESFDNARPMGNMLKPVMDRLRLYMLVGGMPQAVVEYASSGEVDPVESIKRGIIRLYREDIAKYAGSHVAEAMAIFDSIPSQLSRHDKKIKYSSMGAGDRYSDYREAILWLSESMVGNLCLCLGEPGAFGDFSLDPQKVKCYMGDTGLLLTLAAGDNYLNSEIYKSFMLGKLAVNKGMMTENLVAQMLTANGHSLRFYEKRLAEQSDTSAKKYELDFLLTDYNKTLPIEVKSGASSHHPSIDYFREKFRGRVGKGVILTKGDLRVTDEYIYYPLPMAMFL